MQIAKTTDLALRVLIYAFSKQGELVNQQEIADFFGESREHLRKIVHKLAQNGYLNTKRGKHGGFTLAQPADEINIADIVLLFESSTPLVNCEGMSCALINGCLLRCMFDEANHNFVDTLRKYSLLDIVSPSTQQLINITN